MVNNRSYNNKKSFVNTNKYIIENKIKINGEYYIDMAISHAMNSKYKVAELLVDEYISWGTPEELQKFLTKNLII